jgi:hypothetical protein
MKNVLFALIIRSVFVLLLATSLLILTVNTSQAFTPQQPPPPSAAGQQQLPQQAPQANQLVSTQQNTTQSNQPASPPQQQKIPLDQLIGSEDFRVGCTIDSTIYTTNGNWHATGICTLTVSEGELRSFAADMAWNNGTSAHTHMSFRIL